MEKGRGKGTDTLQTDNVFTRKEYIKREAVREMIVGLPCTMSVCLTVEECKGMRRAKEIILKQMERIPAADVVEVVRCKDCKYSAVDFEDRMYCKLVTYYNHVPDDWFCADGERKDGDGDV